MVALVVLAYVDPGIIPKIYSTYEHKHYRHIPIPSTYRDESISEC
jgi:hypothetical protein